MKLKSLALMISVAVTGLVASGAFAPAQATTFTRTSLTSAGLLPTNVSEIGGFVIDLIGLNGNRVVSQTGASNLYTGFASSNGAIYAYSDGTPVPSTDTARYSGNSPINPLTIVTQSGFDATTLALLGGGISQASVRVTLYDGDTGQRSTSTFATGTGNDFDYNQNNLLLNGVAFGNFTTVIAESTNTLGGAIATGSSNGGFRNNLTDTGFFFSSNSTILTTLYNSLVSSNSLTYQLSDTDPGDNYFDFPRGVDASLASISSTPTTYSPTGVLLYSSPATAVPEPFTIVGTIMGGTAAMRMRKKLKSGNKA
jgi:hypothetical protein